MNSQSISPIVFLAIATALEVSGDALLRIALFDHQGVLRACLFLASVSMLFGYSLFLNLAPIEFGQVVGLYIAILFITWQIINFAFFKATPTLPVVLGGSLIVGGGLIVTYWRA